jgi:hypothetical protein
MKSSEKYQFVDRLHDKHHGSAIWIAGSDPSLGDYPDNFFSDKIGITLHLAHLKFPGATYRYASEYDRSEYLDSIDEHYRRLPLIAGWPVYGYSRKATAELFKNFDDVYYHHHFSYPPNGVRGEISAAFTLKKVLQTKAGRAHVWGSHGTCLHNAFYMAVQMGASEINLIGAGHGTYKPGVEHFGSAGAVDKTMRPTYPSFADPVNNVPVIEQTLALIEACKSAGIVVNWYRRYADGDLERLVIDKDWLAEQKKIAAQKKRKPSFARIIYRKIFKRPVYRVISSL